MKHPIARSKRRRTLRRRRVVVEAKREVIEAFEAWLQTFGDLTGQSRGDLEVEHRQAEAVHQLRHLAARYGHLPQVRPVLNAISAADERCEAEG
ncbi:MAG: hypothetical protein KBA31_00200 [Alphaproteobacteria bacterium]|nr:hypothetical protein [Alphaproteobacteria bacterium]